MMKRLIALIAALAVLLALSGCGGQASEPSIAETTVPPTTEPAHAHTVDNGKEWKEWTSTNSLPGLSDCGYNYYLTEDIQLEKAVLLYENAELVVCLNGHTVTSAQGDEVYGLYEGVQLMICDCTGSGVIRPNADAMMFQLNADNARLTLQNVTLDGEGVEFADPVCGAIHVNKFAASVVLDGATVKNFTAVNGPAIYAVGSTNSPAIVEIRNGSMICNNTVLDSSEGSAAVLGYRANILISESTLTENKSYAICGVAVSFASAGGLVLQSANITGNQSLFANPANLQVGAVYIHNGNRNVMISGDTVIDGNIDVNGQPADLYLQRTVRETDINRYPNSLHIYLGALTDNASINICPGLSYDYDQFKKDLNDIQLMQLDDAAETGQNWNNNWIRVDAQDEQIVFDPISQTFVGVRNTSN